MRGPMRLLSLVVAVLATAVLAGCAGGGVGGPLGGSSDAQAAAGQAAAILYVQQWSQILWGLVNSQTGAGPPDFDVSFTPDGERYDVRYPDGTTQVVRMMHQTIFDPPSPPFPNPPPPNQTLTDDWEVTSSRGLLVTYQTVVDIGLDPWDILDDTTTLTGSAVLPGGVTQQSTGLTAAGQSAVESEQSDGSKFTMTAPLFFIWPDMSQPTTGTYESRKHNIQFTLASTVDVPTRWARMSSDFGGGLTGEFTLNPDLSGSGQLVRDGEVVALVSWTRAGEVSVSLVTGANSAAGPAGAALDFLTHLWLTREALLLPAPGG